ncbi:P-type conjugative transfer protein TrbJ [Hyphomonas sp. CY54-11-8]|uniref:P-type conjugative transfer protein TrbJ n=1 Tax=Hyphomonas sp. CY54-11-8 TaxID=1280944 RepID=UPI00068BB124|nr:P-type conjugative transfer protein TrbJ [Hyphomonas sp. CY54-11-8]
MKRLLMVLVLAVAPVAVSPPAHAQFGGIVYDPANHSQNILTAVRSLQEINQQIQQLAHEIEMLDNMAKDLENLPSSIADDIRDKMLTVDQLIRVAEGISYKVAEVETEYEVVYRETYGASPPPTPVIVTEARDAWKQSRSAYKHALQVQAQVVTNIRDDIDKLHSLVGDSQGAVGNLAALQAGNQIAALSAEQIMQIQTLLAAQYRADAMEQSRELAERERGKARLDRFLSGGSSYTPGGGS